MSTSLLTYEWEKTIDDSLEEQSCNDYVIENHFDRNDQENNDDIVDDFLYQLDLSSPEPTMSVPLIQLMNEPSIYRVF